MKYIDNLGIGKRVRFLVRVLTIGGLFFVCTTAYGNPPGELGFDPDMVGWSGSGVLDVTVTRTGGSDGAVSVQMDSVVCNAILRSGGDSACWAHQSAGAKTLTPTIAQQVHIRDALLAGHYCTITLTQSNLYGNATLRPGDETVTIFWHLGPIPLEVSAFPEVLWPPHRKMVPVDISVETEDGSTPYCQVVGVSSNEPVIGTDKRRDTAPDWMIRGDLSVDLRAERSAAGEGRIYSIDVQCTYETGQSVKNTVTVNVPRKKTR